MKNRLLTLYLSVLVLFSISCAKDPDPDPEPDPTPTYNIKIISPNIDLIPITDTLQIKVLFEDTMGGIVENVRIRIYSLIDSSVIYSKPDTSAVASSGSYLFEDFRILSDLPPHSNWVLEASAWGINAEDRKARKTYGFHVHGLKAPGRTQDFHLILHPTLGI